MIYKYSQELWELMDDETKNIMHLIYYDKPVPPPLRICSESSLKPIAYSWYLGNGNNHIQKLKK